MGPVCTSLCCSPLHPHGEAAAKPRTQLLSPSNPSCLVQGHPQKPAADPTLTWGKPVPSGERAFKGLLLGGHPSPARIRGRRVSSWLSWWLRGRTGEAQPTRASNGNLGFEGCEGFQGEGPTWSSFRNTNKTWRAKPCVPAGQQDRGWQGHVPNAQPGQGASPHLRKK